jgi:sterol O-acyltransferase
MLKTSAEYYRSTGKIFDVDILSIMFSPSHFFDCLLTDAIMLYGSSLWNVQLQRVIMNGVISWNSSGWIIQSLWEFTYLWCVIKYTTYKEWPWVQTIFLVLHCLVVLMKQHSYAFYNGYLSEVYKRKKVLNAKLSQLHVTDAHSIASNIASNVKVDQFRGNQSPSSSIDMLDLSQLPDELQPNQLDQLTCLIQSEIDACAAELTLEASNTQRVTYPKNLSYYSYLEYLHFPTVVYELTYPRTTLINWHYVAEKTAAVVGLMAIMILVSQHWIYPVVMECNAMHTQQLSIAARLQEFPWILLRLVFPFMAEYLMVWYLIWDQILNLLAELTMFADRGFYGTWWNSTSWDGFSRDWNKPVHNFLRRHVYHSSISTFQLSRRNATLVTFLISGVVHELIMWCLFKKLRGYLLISQMLQLPLVGLSRTRLLKGRKTIGNVLFWMGIWAGPSVLSASYLIM